MRNIILHLSLIKDIGPATIMTLLERLPHGVDLYACSVRDLEHYIGFSATKAASIVDGLANMRLLEQELVLIEKHAVSWVTFQDAHFPPLLNTIAVPPAVLYYQGSSLDNYKDCFAVVGSRDATAYAHRAIEHIVPDLLAQHWTIVSGGARGVDTMAHQSALLYQGKTIAVLGSGLLCPYPTSNKKLFADIVAKGGALVSPFPLQMEPLAGNFPARNRIISGLSKGCLVVQAAAKSGALITGHYALEQGREVFALPGQFDDPLSAGCHTLLKEGAKLVTASKDILEEFGIHQGTKPVLSVKKLPNEAEDPIIKACTQPQSLHEIHAITGISIDNLQLKMFELQIEGRLQQNFAGLWEKV